MTAMDLGENLEAEKDEKGGMGSDLPRKGGIKE